MTSDRDLPEAYNHFFDGPEQRFLSSMNVQGVPVSYIIGVGERVVDLTAGLSAGDPAKITKAALGILKEPQERYPDCPSWDGIRMVLVRQLVGLQAEAPALEVAYEVRAAHRAVGVLHTIAALRTTHDERAAAMYVLVQQAPEERRPQFMRAMRDWLLVNASDLLLAEQIDQELIDSGVEQDSIDGWAESQAQLYPYIETPYVIDTIRNDALWGDIDLSHRRVVMGWELLNGYRVLRGEAMESALVAALIENYHGYAEEYSPLPIWDYLRGDMAAMLLRRGYPNEAVQLARTMEDSQIIGGTIFQLIEADFEEQALELATAPMADTNLQVDILMYGPWQDGERPRQWLADQINQDTQRARELKIAQLELFRDKAVRDHNLVRALEFQENIDKLKRQQ